MAYRDAIEKIEAGLTGDNDKDIRFLLAEAESYKDHEYGTEIVKYIGRLVYTLLPEEERKQVDQTEKDAVESRNKTYYEAVEAMSDGQLGCNPSLYTA